MASVTNSGATAPPSSPAPASSPRRDGAGTAWQVSCRSVDLARELSFDTAPLPPSSTKKRRHGRRKYGRRSWLASPADAIDYKVFRDFGSGATRAARLLVRDHACVISHSTTGNADVHHLTR